MFKKILLLLSISTCVGCGRIKNQVGEQPIIFPKSMVELEQIVKGSHVTILVPISYSCSSCIETIALWRDIVNKQIEIKEARIVFLARGEVDDYFLHNISNIKYDYYLVNDKFNEFLSCNDIRNLGNSSSILLVNGKVIWSGYPLNKKSDQINLMRILKRIKR